MSVPVAATNWERPHELPLVAGIHRPAVKVWWAAQMTSRVRGTTRARACTPARQRRIIALEPGTVVVVHMQQLPAGDGWSPPHARSSAVPLWKCCDLSRCAAACCLAAQMTAQTAACWAALPGLMLPFCLQIFLHHNPSQNLCFVACWLTTQILHATKRRDRVCRVLYEAGTWHIQRIVASRPP